jgi:hypothetical protein
VSGSGRRIKGKGKGGRIKSTYFIGLYENRAMKFTEIILRRGRRMMKGMKLTKVHCKHIWKCNNGIPYTTNICYSQCLKVNKYILKG